MLLYANRGGRPISRERWRRLLRKPAYCLVRRARRGKVTVELSWLGVASTWEAEPGYFLLQATGTRGEGEGAPEDLVPPRWFACKHEGLAGFVRLAEDLELL